MISVRDPATGMLFYVESNGRRLVAFGRGGEVAWSVDVLAEAGARPLLGRQVVRDLRVEGGTLWATCGKSDAVRIDVRTGRAEYAGRD